MRKYVFDLNCFSGQQCGPWASCLFIILQSVLLAAVLCNNMLCTQDALLQNLQNFKIIFSSFEYFFTNWEKNRVGGSVKLKIKFLLPFLNYYPLFIHPSINGSTFIDDI